MSISLNYNLVRYAAGDRTAVVTNDSPVDLGQQAVAISTHLYHGPYYPGSLPLSGPTPRYAVSCTDGGLHFSLTLPTPKIDRLLKSLSQEDHRFFKEEYISLNFIDSKNRVVQVTVRPDGQWRLSKNGKKKTSWSGTIAAAANRTGWTAEITVPLSFLGFSADDFSRHPIPFDLVRYNWASGEVSAWCPIPDQLPFNELYNFPVFCFGLLSARPVRWTDYRPAAKRLGRITYQGPKRPRAGDHFSAKLIYTVGAVPFNEGGSLRFNLSNEVIECNRRSSIKRHLPEKDWSPLQWTQPTQAGYITVNSSRKSALFKLENVMAFSTRATLISGGPLTKGDTVTVTVGDPGPGIRSQLLAQKNYPWKCFYDLSGNGIYLPPPKLPVLTVEGGRAESLVVNAHPTPVPGVDFRVTVTAVDTYGNPADRYRGTVGFFTPVKLNGLPSSYTFTAADRGTAEFTVTLREKAEFTIQALDSKDSTVSGTSHLLVSTGVFGPKPLFFGDIHTHSQLSDGRLPLEEKYREAALHRGLDFWVSTDHDYDLTAERLEELNRVTEQVNRPGMFAAFPGYEWTGSMGYGKPFLRKQYGHRNVIFDKPIETVYHSVSPNSDTPQKLKDALKKAKNRHIIINHFHCGDPAMVPGVDDHIEISGWCGDFVREAASTTRAGTSLHIEDILKKGFRVATYAGTDHGTEAYYTGLPAELTAVHAAKLDRKAIFSGLSNGTGYATSGQKTLLRFTVNGKAPSVNTKPITEKVRRLKITVGSSMPVISVQIIRNGQLLKSFPGHQFGVTTIHFEDADTHPSSGYYYIRVNTAQGHHAWSSAVFFRLGGK